MTQQEKNNYLLRFKRFQQSRERLFAPKIFKAIRSQYNTVIQHAKAEGLEASLNRIDTTPISTTLKELYTDAATIYGAKVRADLQRQKARMPMGFSEAVRAMIEAYYKTDILNTSQGITDTTKDLIREVFSNAYEIGLGIDDIIVQLENTELSRIRARLIARTETVTAANQGAMFVGSQSGYPLNKEWLAAIDNRTRRDHAAVNGIVIPFADYFDVNGYKMMQPGDRGGRDGNLKTPAKEVCNCRCTVLMIPVTGVGSLQPVITRPSIKPLPFTGTKEDAKADIKALFKEKYGMDIKSVNFHDDMPIDKINRYGKKIEELTNDYNIPDFVKQSTPEIEFKSTASTYGSVSSFNFGKSILKVNFGHNTDATRGLPERVTLFSNIKEIRFAGKSRTDSDKEELATLVHEFAHFISTDRQTAHGAMDASIPAFWKEAKSLKNKYSREVKPLISYYSQESIEDRSKKLNEFYLGDYASTKLNEFMAEAFTEYKLKTNPSKYAKLMGELIDKYFKNK